MKLIINSDDFGLSKSITDGIIDGINYGCISSTSIMANMKYAKYAIEKAIKNDINCIGLHINLTVGNPVIKNKLLTDENGNFLYNRKQIENIYLTKEAVYNEIMAQIELVKKYSNNKIKVDHLDMHHHLSDNENIVNAIKEIANNLDIPVRNQGIKDVKTPDYLFKEFTINNVNINTLEKFINENKNTKYSFEIMTHAGYIDDETKEITSYLDRQKELECLKKAKDMGLFKQVDLISFKEI